MSVLLLNNEIFLHWRHITDPFNLSEKKIKPKVRTLRSKIQHGGGSCIFKVLISFGNTKKKKIIARTICH